MMEISGPGRSNRVVALPAGVAAETTPAIVLLGWTLARAHAQSGNAKAIASYLGTGEQFDDAVTEFALAYADQSEVDYQALVEAIDSGRLQAERGV